MKVVDWNEIGNALDWWARELGAKLAEEEEDALDAGFDHCVVTHGILCNGQPATVDICLDCEDEFDLPVARESDYRGVVERGHYGTCEHPLHPGRSVAKITDHCSQR